MHELSVLAAAREAPRRDFIVAEDLETGKVIPLEAWRSNRMGTVQSGSTLITRRNVGELYWVVITPPRRVKGWQPPRA